MEQGIQIARTESDKMQKLKALLKKYKQQHKIQMGLLELAKLTSTITDINDFRDRLRILICTYFPAENLYFQLHAVPNEYDGLNFYVDKMRFSAIENKLHTDVIELIKTLNKPLYLRNNQVLVLEDEDTVSSRSFESRDNEKAIGEDWLLSPIIVADTTIGIVGIKSFKSRSEKPIVDLKLIDFVALLISSAIQKLCVAEQLKSYNTNVEDVVVNRTKELQQANQKLLKQVEERRKVEQKLYFAAHHDTLTKLPNRSMFTERLEHSLLHLNRHPSHRFAVLFIDLDRFKIINDTLGHHIGDQLLIQITERIAECVRGNDILARLGGDEFVILLDTLAAHRDAQDVAMRIVDSIEKPFIIENQEVYSSVSIGITICEKDYHSATEILRDADAAMYQAKSLGRGRIVFFDDTMRAELLANLSLEDDLRTAVDDHQFKLYFQSIIDLDSQQVKGYEVFLRWQHPTKGLLLPSEFIALAEDSGFIIEIEFWLIKKVGELLKKWQLSPEHQLTCISINLSGKHILQQVYLDALLNVIENHIPNTARLTIEFKESGFTDNHDDVLKYLTTLKKAGVKLALGGYGSGLSSLNYIQNYPFDFIKFDQLFIRSLEHNQKNYALALSLCNIGEKFNIDYVAEGIETYNQYTVSNRIGCSLGQGFFIDKPNVLSQIADVSIICDNG